MSSRYIHIRFLSEQSSWTLACYSVSNSWGYNFILFPLPVIDPFLFKSSCVLLALQMHVWRWMDTDANHSGTLSSPLPSTAGTTGKTSTRGKQPTQALQRATGGRSSPRTLDLGPSVFPQHHNEVVFFFHSELHMGWWLFKSGSSSMVMLSLSHDTAHNKLLLQNTGTKILTESDFL